MQFRLAILVFIISSGKLLGQTMSDSIPRVRLLDINPRIVHYNDSTWIYSGICKPLKISKPGAGLSNPMTAVSKISFLTIHGNVQYDFLYRSFADTPFYQKDFRQHTIKTTLSVTVKDKYPFRVNFVVRKSNSPFFKDFFDGGLQFDKLSYYRNIKQELLNKISKKIPEQSYLNAAKALLEKQTAKYNSLKNKLSANGLAQQLIEERERNYFRSLQKPDMPIPGKKEIGIDSLAENLQTLIAEKRKELDSLQHSIEQLKGKVDSIQGKIADRLAKARQRINKAGDLQELAKIAGDNGLDQKKDKAEKFINNLKTAGIGRNILNYSELTARNVSLTGVNLEYNPRLYFAFAAGKIDYGFRDFFGKNNRSLNQHLVMGRVGIGDIEKRAIIFSLFTGRKANYGSVLSDTVSGNILVTGYSVETIVKKDENTFFSAEIAKSTKPVTGSYAENKQLGSLFSFSDESNLGVSVKGQTLITDTKTRLSGFFRKTGENFQSFSLFSYNTDQTAWMLKADQHFLKDRVNLIGIVRKNDFVNPFTEKTFKTSTVFGSAQLSIRFPKWPSVSIGYHPGSQLYIIDRNRVRENVYYILNGTIVHQYKIAGLRLVSSAIYNNYTTRGTDSGFINYSGKNYMVSQSVYIRQLQLQGNFMYTDQQELKFYTVEANADYSLQSAFRLGAGIKYNKILSGGIFWGGTGQLQFEIKRLGNLQLQYEKSFLPTIQQTLFPVEIGRLTWFKNF
jgi:hypothetical protein